MKKTVLGFSLLAMACASSVARAQNHEQAKKLYASYCATCHGDKGKGDGVAAGALPVKPRNHTDGAVMNPLSDQHLSDIIAKGGAAVGKSGFMPAWGASLNEKQIRDLVAYIRTLAVPPHKP